ncbi:MAG: efflux RND transporter periplasmic adaptor subunit [Brumimicrobium sp.]
MSKYQIIILLAGVLIASCEEETTAVDENQGEINFTEVDYYVTKGESIDQIISIPGKTMPYEQINVYSEINGRVKQINFEEGEVVKKGAVLVKIDTDILQAQKKQRQVELDLALKDRDRKKQLYENEAGTLEAFEQAQSSAANLEAQIDLLNVQIDKGIIRAPFNGKVGLRSISEGAFVTTSDLITKLAQIDKLKISFSVAQRYTSLVKVGQKIKISPPSDSIDINPLSAEVYAFEPTIDKNTQMLNVRAKLEKNKAFIPGGYVKVEYNLGASPNSILVPTGAIAPVVDGQIVWKFENNKAKRVKVNVGTRTNDQIQLFGDISAGDTVVVSGLLGMQEGKNIKPKKEK